MGRSSKRLKEGDKCAGDKCLFRTISQAPGNIAFFYCENSQTMLVSIGSDVVHFTYESMHDESQFFAKHALPADE